MTTTASWWARKPWWAKAGWIAETFVLNLIGDVETFAKDVINYWRHGA